MNAEAKQHATVQDTTTQIEMENRSLEEILYITRSLKEATVADNKEECEQLVFILINAIKHQVKREDLRAALLDTAYQLREEVVLSQESDKQYTIKLANELSAILQSPDKLKSCSSKRQTLRKFIPGFRKKS